MKAFKAALPYTIPICVGFLFLGMSYGFLMKSKGFSFVYPMLMSFFIFAGSMEFVTVNLLLSAFNPLYAFFLKCSSSILWALHVGKTQKRWLEKTLSDLRDVR